MHELEKHVHELAERQIDEALSSMLKAQLVSHWMAPRLDWNDRNTAFLKLQPSQRNLKQYMIGVSNNGIHNLFQVVLKVT